jgi:hypothetical protein
MACPSLGRVDLCNDKSLLTQIHAFIVRIWQEQGLTRPDGRTLWRGRVQHAASGRSLVFQSPSELWRFIASRTGSLQEKRDGDRATRDRPASRTGDLEKGGRHKDFNAKKSFEHLRFKPTLAEAKSQDPFDDLFINQRRK